MNRTEIQKQIEKEKERINKNIEVIKDRKRNIAILESQLKDERVFRFVANNEHGYAVNGNFTVDQGKTSENYDTEGFKYPRFEDKESAERWAKVSQLLYDMHKWQSENDEAVSLKNNAYVIRYDRTIKIFTDGNWREQWHPFEPKFSSETKAQECLEVFRDRLTEVVEWFR